MTCLHDYIGLKGCSTEVPGSGLYINSLPGISLESLEKIANAEQLTYLGVWSDVQDRAVTILSSRINEEFKKRYKLKTIRQLFNAGRKVNTLQTTPADDVLRGTIIELSCEDSPLRSISVDHVNIYLQTVTTAALPIKFIDMDSGEELHSLELAVSDQLTGWNTVNVNKSFDASRLFICYNASEVDAVEQRLSDHCCTEFSQATQSVLNCSGLLSGAQSDTDLSDATYGNNTYGLSPVFAITCSFDALICDNRDSFKTALWWLLGAEMMMERIYGGSRINKWTLDKTAASELKDYYHNEFEKALANCIEGIDLNTCDCCIDCHEQVIIKETLP